MPEEISVQILSQASENIQKLFDLSTRIDERVKAIQAKQDSLDERLDETLAQHVAVMQKVAVLEAKDSNSIMIEHRIVEIQKELVEVDKRLIKVEGDSSRTNDRWKSIGTFVIQLIWVILAAYLLAKLNLQSPNIP